MGSWKEFRFWGRRPACFPLLHHNDFQHRQSAVAHRHLQPTRRQQAARDWTAIREEACASSSPLEARLSSSHSRVVTRAIRKPCTKHRSKRTKEKNTRKNSWTQRSLSVMDWARSVGHGHNWLSLNWTKHFNSTDLAGNLRTKENLTQTCQSKLD